MITRLPILLLFLAYCQPDCSLAQGQYPPLPRLQVNRRADGLYMDSVARLAKDRYRTITALPPTALNDTLRFKALYFLGNQYKWWYSRRDSTVYIGNLLINEARKSRNRFYEVNGKLILEEHYRNGQVNTPLALRLNFEILSILPATAFYDVVRIRANLNLGDLYGISKDYTNALRYLMQAQKLLENELVYAGPLTTNVFRVEVEQHLGTVYKQQNNFIESEAHYQRAETLLGKTSSEVSLAYVYDDLAELYLQEKRYAPALYYAKKAEAIWNRVKSRDESKSWGTLACVYTGLGQDNLAFEYARKVMDLPKPPKFVREQAYMALYQLYERRQDWQNSALYYKKYVAQRDTIASDQHSLELVSIQKQAELDLLSLQSQQAHQLQADQLLTVQKKAELDQLRADAQANLLTKKVFLAEQQRLEEQVRLEGQVRLARQQRFVEKERAKTELIRQRIRQELQEYVYAQRADAEEQTRSWLMAGLFGVMLFTLALGFVYEKNRAQKRQIAQLNAGLEQLVSERTAELLTANDELLQKNQAIKEADARIIQTQETERQRIAADLHDDLGGTLATLRRRLTDLRQYMHEPKIIREFDALQPLILKSSADLRRIAHNLMPPEFARIGLRYALEQLVRSQPMQPTRFSFLTSGPEQKLPLNTELNAYRIISELVQNINKHAQANQAAVQLLYHNDRLTITVDDDGLGNQATTTTNEPAGIGLKNIRLRADYIGATLWQESGEAGTLVILDIPYSASVSGM